MPNAPKRVYATMRETHRCANPTCRKSFTVELRVVVLFPRRGQPRQFCRPTCSQTARQRRYRATHRRTS